MFVFDCIDLFKMVEDFAVDCSKLLQLNVNDELAPIHQSVDEMLTRLEEFETLIKVLQDGPHNLSTKAYNKMIECKPEIEILNTRVNFLHVFVTRVNTDLSILERQLETAETQLGIPDTTIKGLLKPFLTKISKEPANNIPVSKSVLNYKRPELFKTTDYFP